MRRALSTPLLLLAVVLGLGCVQCQPVMSRVLGVDEIEAEELRDALAAEHPPLVIDNRLPERFSAGHIAGALPLRPDEIDGYLARRGPPCVRPVVLVCNRGNSSLRDAATVRGHGYLDVRSLRGGMARWNALGLPTERGAAEPIDPDLLTPPVLDLSRFEQWIPVIAAFVVKPVYMLLTLALILWLWPRRERGLDLIRFGLVSFLTGEWLCAANFMATSNGSALLEIGHQLGMVGASALVPWGFFVLLDQRVLRFTDATAPCVAMRLCKECWKRTTVSCGVHRVMLLVAPVLALVSAMPLCVGVRPVNLTVPLLGTDVSYHYTFAIMIPELRVYPLIACVILLVGSALLWRGRRGLRLAEPCFFIGLGFMLFSLFRFTLLEAYRTIPIWMDFWEESTELAAMAGVGLFLLAFRRQLGLWWVKRRPAAPEESS